MWWTGGGGGALSIHLLAQVTEGGGKARSITAGCLYIGLIGYIAKYSLSERRISFMGNGQLQYFVNAPFLILLSGW